MGTTIRPSTRRASNPSVSSRSRTGSSSELPASVSTDRGAATSSTALWTSEKNGFATSSKTSPIVADARLARRRLPAIWSWR